MSDRRKLDTYCRPYAIVRCLHGCDLTFNGETLSEHDGPEVDALRRLARKHCAETGHATEYDQTKQYRFAPRGTTPQWEAR